MVVPASGAASTLAVSLLTVALRPKVVSSATTDYITQVPVVRNRDELLLYGVSRPGRGLPQDIVARHRLPPDVGRRQLPRNGATGAAPGRWVRHREGRGFETELCRLVDEEDTTWSFFLDDDASKPVWSKIVVAVHSQGSGMDVRVARTHAVAWVVQLVGVGDNVKGEAAPWLSDTGSATSPGLLYGLVHEDDLMARVRITWPVLGMAGSEYYVDNGDACCGEGYTMLFSRDKEFTCPNLLVRGRVHYIALDSKFALPWSYMRTRGVKCGDDAGNTVPPCVFKR